MKILIVEDERIAAERLSMMVKEYDSQIQILGCLESIEDTVSYLKQHQPPDLILLDIHLSDGHSFDIFQQLTYNRPVVFTTAYDQYALEAFKTYSIDYILKPVTQEALAKAMNKYKNMMSCMTYDQLRMLQFSPNDIEYKKRFLCRIGKRLHFLETEEIAYFEADNKIVHVVDNNGNQYLTEHTMEALELLLNPKQFFRINRRFIVRIGVIDQIKPYFNNRLKLQLRTRSQPDELVISRERVADFKLWADN